MDYYDHFFSYVFAWVAFSFFLAIYDLFEIWFVIALFFAFFLINPDIDLLAGIEHHRNFVTHSALYPILMYWIFHPWWNMATASQLGILLFYPEIVHLVGDFYNFMKDLKGSALISVLGKRMTTTQSKGFILANIVGMGAYIIFVF